MTDMAGGHGFNMAAAPVEWNRLPLNVQSEQTILGFRSQLKAYLIPKTIHPSHPSRGGGGGVGWGASLFGFKGITEFS